MYVMAQVNFVMLVGLLTVPMAQMKAQTIVAMQMNVDQIFLMDGHVLKVIILIRIVTVDVVLQIPHVMMVELAGRTVMMAGHVNMEIQTVLKILRQNVMLTNGTVMAMEQSVNLIIGFAMAGQIVPMAVMKPTVLKIVQVQLVAFT